jgi:hypothetical protein
MITLITFTTLGVATILALAAGTAFQWVFLQATYRLMQPATARRRAAGTGLARGSSQLARSYASHR